MFFVPLLRVFTIVVLAIASLPLLAQEPTVDVRSQDSIDETQLFRDRGITDKWLKQKNIPAVGIGYIENGTIKELTIYGGDDSNHPNPVDLIFNVASLTKPIT